LNLGRMKPLYYLRNVWGIPNYDTVIKKMLLFFYVAIIFGVFWVPKVKKWSKTEKKKWLESSRRARKFTITS
jgi:flagellar biosynthesis protein FlhB